MVQQTLIYLHDPMCSWCWAFQPLWQRLVARLPAEVTPRRLLGGLAADSDEPMPEAMQRYLQQTWHTIEQQVAGTRFNFDFWQVAEPRRSTWPACRAVIAARVQGAAFEVPMIEAIQRAYYLEARNPSDRETLVALAAAIGLDPGGFSQQLDSAASQAQLAAEIAEGRTMGVASYPALILQSESGFRPLQHNYLSVQAMLEQL